MWLERFIGKIFPTAIETNVISGPFASTVYPSNKGGLMQHSVPDEWNAWSIQRNSLGKFSVLNRSNITPAMIPRHHTRNGRIIRIGVLSDPASGKVSFVNATVRPRRIIHSFRHGLF